MAQKEYEFLIETDNSFYIKKEDIKKLAKVENYVPLSACLENADESNSFFNVIGFIREKTVIVV